jgi:hypothetical protein
MQGFYLCCCAITTPPPPPSFSINKIVTEAVFHTGTKSTDQGKCLHSGLLYLMSMDSAGDEIGVCRKTSNSPKDIFQMDANFQKPEKMVGW